MRKELIYSLIMVMILSLAPQDGLSCTTFSLVKDNQSIVGKNYDWHLEDGLIIINKRGVYKKAMQGSQKGSDRYATWTSKYGSLTFNQYGREMPSGGINEAGLVVELMLLSSTKYPTRDARPAIKDLQWIQYQLDNHKKVEEVIASDTQVRILTNEKPGLHFLVADKTGNCAVIEFLDGKLNYHFQDTMTVRALTNHTYGESIEFLRMHKGFGGQFPIARGGSSLKRFIYTAKMMKAYNSHLNGSAIEYGFGILENVSQPSTRWSIIYDQDRLRVHFRTFSNVNIRYVDLEKLDFSCAAPVIIFDISAGLSGDIRESFYEYSYQTNLDLITYSITGTPFMKHLSGNFIRQRAKYPESTYCAE